MLEKIILGTVQFGMNYGINNSVGQVNQSEINSILEFCKKCGILTLDTASSYGNSEENIGNYLQLSDEKNPFRIITKFDLKRGISLIESLERSLIQLKVDYVDTVMFHSYFDFKNISISELNKLLSFKGSKFKNLGISLYKNEEIDEICDLNLFSVIQTPFNALDNHKLRGVALSKLKNSGLEVHTRSVFLQGLFLMDVLNFPTKLKPLVKYIRLLDEISNDFRIDKAALVLQYVLNKNYIDNVLIGVDSLIQLENNLKKMNLTIPNKAFDAVDQISVMELDLINPSLWHQ